MSRNWFVTELDEMMLEAQLKARITRRMQCIRGQLLAMRCNGSFWISTEE